ncbi:unnamed protein product [Brachionus calyciflorus]|uniref:Dolichyl-diphosphooligosaccharide--protein glycosyltransferase subunit 2 n=1 Tax=Brachionus calyciflorus TaxID=104777 RepID=A0A814D3W2_9BILA|nr:unnamed protein product [Brachionus calyciflorus]
MTSKSLFCFGVLLASVAFVLSATNSNYPTINLANLRRVFDAAKPYSDLSNAFYSVKGLTLLGEKFQQQQHAEICNLAKLKLDKNSIESVFFALSLARSVPNCDIPSADYQQTLTKAASSQNVADLYYYTQLAELLKTPIDSVKVSKSLLEGLKADSSVLNQGYSLHIASLLSEGQKTFYDNIEDLLEQADEVDKKFLQYEGGVGTTSLVLEGVFELSAKLKKFPAKFDQAKLTKFVNYLTSKRSPTNPKSAYFLLKAALKLSDNQFHIPLVLNRLSSVSVSSQQPNLLISVTNIVGASVRQAQFNVEAESAKSAKSTLLSAKKPFTQKSSDGTTYELKLVEQQPTADFYTVLVSVTPKAPANNDKRFYLVDNKVLVKVSTVASVSDVQIGTGDRDQGLPKLKSVQENQKLKEKLEADQQSKLYVRFSVKDKLKGANLEVHQAFLRFSEAKSGREIIFLAQFSNNQYSADVDLATNAKSFRRLSGVYSVELVVADALLQNPISWTLADVNLHFNEEPSSDASQDRAALFSKKPEIQHLFRPAEKTPPAAVSTVFTALTLAPLALLIILWLSIGVNFSKFSFSLSGIVFHVALAGIFGLFYCYWVKLNMFQTIKYLALLGAVAFFAGNKLLRSLATDSKEKKQ